MLWLELEGLILRLNRKKKNKNWYDAKLQSDMTHSSPCLLELWYFLLLLESAYIFSLSLPLFLFSFLIYIYIISLYVYMYIINVIGLSLIVNKLGKLIWLNLLATLSFIQPYLLSFFKWERVVVLAVWHLAPTPRPSITHFCNMGFSSFPYWFTSI